MVDYEIWACGNGSCSMEIDAQRKRKWRSERGGTERKAMRRLKRELVGTIELTIAIVLGLLWGSENKEIANYGNSRLRTMGGGDPLFFIYLRQHLGASDPEWNN